MLKNHGPGGCCCNECYTLTDPFEDLDLEASNKIREVTWIIASTLNNLPFPNTITHEQGFVVFEPDIPDAQRIAPISNEPPPDKTFVPNSSKEYGTMFMGRTIFEIERDSSTSFYVSQFQASLAFQFAPDGTIRLGFLSGSVFKSFTPGILTLPGSIDHLRIRIDLTEWELWDLFGVTFDAVQNVKQFWIPLNVSVQAIDDDPEIEEDWTWIWTGAILRNGNDILSNGTQAPHLFSAFFNSNTETNGTIAPDDDGQFSSQVTIKDFDAQPANQSLNNFKLRDWSWKADKFAYSLSECPQLENRLWHFFDWQNGNFASDMKWTFREMATNILDREYVLPAKQDRYDSWEFDGFDFGDSIVKKVNGVSYSLVVKKLEVSYYYGTVSWVITFDIQEWDEIQTVPPAPFDVYRVFGFTPCHDVQAGDINWPRNTDYNHTTIIYCDNTYFIGREIFDVFIGTDWDWTFSS